MSGTLVPMSTGRYPSDFRNLGYFWENRVPVIPAGTDQISIYADHCYRFCQSNWLLEYQLLQTIVKDHIVQILLRYDVCTVQEIRESSGASFPKLVADMNSIAGDIYDFHVGARQASVS